MTNPRFAPTLSSSNGADVYCGVQAIKNTVYTFCNTYYTAKTYDPTIEITTVKTEAVFRWWIPALVGVNVLVVAIIGVWVYVIFFKDKNKEAREAE